jgi:hypothetical protein
LDHRLRIGDEFSLTILPWRPSTSNLILAHRSQIYALTLLKNPRIRQPLEGRCLQRPGSCKQLPSMRCCLLSAFSAESELATGRSVMPPIGWRWLSGTSDMDVRKMPIDGYFFRTPSSGRSNKYCQKSDILARVQEVRLLTHSPGIFYDDPPDQANSHCSTQRRGLCTDHHGVARRIGFLPGAFGKVFDHQRAAGLRKLRSGLQ